CAERFIGPSIDDAIDTLHWLQEQIDERTAWLLDHKMRKITPDLGWPVYLMPVDEVAYYSATVGTNVQQRSSTPATGMWWPAAGHPGSSRSRPPSGPARTSSPPRCGPCSGTGGRFAAPTKPARTPSSATAGPAPGTPRPRSTHRPAG